MLDKLQTEQILDLRPIDFLRPVPLELIERLEDREACEADASLQALILAPGDLALDQALEVVERRPLLFGGGLREFMIVGTHVGQLQSRQ